MGKHNGIWKIATIVGALALAVAMPLAALAETVDQTPPLSTEATQAASNAATGATQTMPQLTGRGHQGGFGLKGFGFGTGTSSLTEAQKSAYQEALNTYVAAEDEQLANLVSAGVLTQGEVDTHKIQRANQQTLSDIDTSSWTADQLTALRDALSKSGDERKEALSALVTGGQLTQAQADALSALSGNTQSVWQKISGLTDDATVSALNAMQHAQLSFQQALSKAGISGKGMGGLNIGGLGGFGGRGSGTKGAQGFGNKTRGNDNNANNGRMGGKGF